MLEPRIHPHSLEAEQAILGGLLIDNSAWHRVSDRIAENDFYLDEHRCIYRHIKQLLERGSTATVNNIAGTLDAASEIDRVGGLSYLKKLTGSAPSTDGIRELAAIIVEKSLLRQLLTAADQIAADALNPDGRLPDDLIAAAEVRIADLGESCCRRQDNLCHINSLMTRELERIQELHDREIKSELIGVPSGFTALDEMTQGFRRGDLIVLAGRPAMGKTALALNIARHVSLVAGLPVLICSLEGGDGHLIRRLIASVGQIDPQRLWSGVLTDQEWSRLSYALGMLHEAPIYISESEQLSPDRLRSEAKRFCRLYGATPGLIVVDFIQLMATQTVSANRAEEMFKICRSLKSLAEELDVPVIALSQLPGPVEQRVDKRPILSDLMDCGPVEQLADLILMLYRDEYYRVDSPDQGLVEIFVGKQRNGPTGRTAVRF